MFNFNSLHDSFFTLDGVAIITQKIKYIAKNHEKIRENCEIFVKLCLHSAQYSKSQIFVQKFNSDKTPQHFH